jgi:hypothetical protein
MSHAALSLCVVQKTRIHNRLKDFSTNLIEKIMHASHVYIRYKTEYMEA